MSRELAAFLRLHVIVHASRNTLSHFTNGLLSCSLNSGLHVLVVVLALLAQLLGLVELARSIQIEMKRSVTSSDLYGTFCIIIARPAIVLLTEPRTCRGSSTFNLQLCVKNLHYS